MKIIGVCADFLRPRIRAAVSKPSMPGMFTSSRMTANSLSRTCRSASWPERTVITVCPNSARTDSRTSNFSGSSSITRMLTLSFIDQCHPWLAIQPRPQDGQQLLRIDGFGEIIPGPGLDAFLPVAFHGLGRHGDDRE